MNQFQDVFISYGRADSKSFAKKLNDRLVAEGLEVWFDFDDIPLGVDYQNQIDDGIEKSDNFVYIISPHSVNSPYCAKEVNLALRRNKRLIPLLHVEQISRETWQQRHPHGTDAEWLEYQARGAHSSFPNMHPEISKINWVYCREGVDDFEAALANLLRIFSRQKIYVHQHTRILAQALEWERGHRRSTHLLVGEARQQAEIWLKTRFQDEQPPCLPTNLHCEYITESIKNANNLMTQVFLSWANEDMVLMQQIRQDLLREGITIWVSKADIKTGANFQQEINRGIEEADNIVYLISPDSLESQYCQQEITYALSLNKRIIPLLIHPVDLAQIPAALRLIQFINFADNTTTEQHQRDMAKLIKILREDESYHAEHKILLTKALKWDRQQGNPSMLLRGYNLRHAEAWLKVARKREQYRPTELQQDFIEQSLRQPSGVALDVFVSYSRRDSEFARRLNDALQIQGKTTWFDQESIAAGSTDFQREIYHGIESADHFLFIISPASINSPYCADEVEYAVKLSKRIVTVLYQPVDPATLPPGLATVQWLDFNQNSGNFDTNFSTLLRTLETDPDYLRTHTKLLVRALEWDHKDRDDSLLLRGNLLHEMNEWLCSSEDKSPAPTTLQRDFISASDAAELQRQRSTVRLQRLGMAVISTISVVAIALGLTAFKQKQVAQRLQLQAYQEEILAQTKTSEALFQSQRVFEALLEAMAAGIKLEQIGLSTGELRAPVVTALQQAVFWVRQNQLLSGHKGIIWTIATSTDGQMIASASADGTVRLWHRDGHLLHEIPGKTNVEMLAVAFSPDNKYLVTGNNRGEVVLYHIETSTTQLIGKHDEPVTSVAVAPNGELIASASEDSTIQLWTFGGKRVKTLTGHDAAVRSVSFSPTGQTIASASDDRTIRLWQSDGTPLRTLTGHTAEVQSVSFSPNNRWLVSASWDQTVRLWRADGAPIRTIQAHDALVYDAVFTPDSKTIVSASNDKTINVWSLDGSLITTISGHSGQVRSLSFNARDGSLASAGGDRTIRLWTVTPPLVTALPDHRARVFSVAFSPDDQILASAGADNSVRLWQRQGQFLKQLSGHQSVIWSVTFSPDGKELASASSDFTVKRWDRNGKLLQTLIGHRGPVYAVDYSPDGQLIASAGADKTLRLWRRDGQPIRTIQGIFDKGILVVRFSPDGKTIATSGWDSKVRLWNHQGKLLTTLAGHQGWIYDVNFSHDGKRLVTASYDNTAIVWNLKGDILATLQNHEDGVSAARFSQDDQLIATASHDHTVKLWHSDGRLITTLRGHSDRVSDVSFSHDGQLLATASEDKTVMLWNLNLRGELDKLLARGCQWTRNYLQTAPDAPPDIRTFCQQMDSSQTADRSGEQVSLRSPK